MDSKINGNDMIICMGKLDSKILPQLVFLMKQVINHQKDKIDMLTRKIEKKREKNLNYWFITVLFILIIGLRIYLLQSQDMGNLILEQKKTISSQSEMIELLQNEVRELRQSRAQEREFYSNMFKFLFICISFGFSLNYYFLTGLKNKIRHQDKLITEQIYQGVIQGLIQKKFKVEKNDKLTFSLLFLSGTAFFIFVLELYIVSTLF